MSHTTAPALQLDLGVGARVVAAAADVDDGEVAAAQSDFEVKRGS